MTSSGQGILKKTYYGDTHRFTSQGDISVITLEAGNTESLNLQSQNDIAISINAGNAIAFQTIPIDSTQTSLLQIADGLIQKNLDTTNAFNQTTGSVILSGGIGIIGDLYANNIYGNQLISQTSTQAPFIVNSTTLVGNLYVARALIADSTSSDATQVSNLLITNSLTSVGTTYINNLLSNLPDFEADTFDDPILITQENQTWSDILYNSYGYILNDVNNQPQPDIFYNRVIVDNTNTEFFIENQYLGNTRTTILFNDSTIEYNNGSGYQSLGTSLATGSYTFVLSTNGLLNIYNSSNNIVASYGNAYSGVGPYYLVMDFGSGQIGDLVISDSNNKICWSASGLTTVLATIPTVSNSL